MSVTHPEPGANASGDWDTQTLAGLVDETALLFSESRDYHRDEAIKRVLGEALGSLRMLKHRLASARSRYSVGVVGQTNVGKSTLLNALFGCEIAPRRNGPCTAAPIEFQYGDSWGVAVSYEQSLKRPVWSCPDLARVHMKLAELGSGADVGSGRDIRKIAVDVPFDLLREGLIICDTPGFNAAQTGEAEGLHEESLKRYLRTEVSQVLWVVSAEQAIGKAEMAFHADFFAEICDDIVVTNCDSEGEMWDERDRARFRKRYTDRFGYRLPNFHFVSGSWGFEARQQMDTDKLMEAGIPDLEKRICTLAIPENRMRDIYATWNRLGEDIAVWLATRETEAGANAKRWRPDSWARWVQTAMQSEQGRIMANRLSQESVSFTSIKSQAPDVTPLPMIKPQQADAINRDTPPNRQLKTAKTSRFQLDLENAHQQCRRAEWVFIVFLVGITIFSRVLLEIDPASRSEEQYLHSTTEFFLMGSSVVAFLAGAWLGWRSERVRIVTSNWALAFLKAAFFAVIGILGYVTVAQSTYQPQTILSWHLLNGASNLSLYLLVAAVGCVPGIILSMIVSQKERRKGRR